MIAKYRSTVWLDANGYQTITLIGGNASLNTIMTALAAASNAAWQYYWESSATYQTSPTPIAAQYIQGNQYAEMIFNCADGTSASLKLPAPQIGCFLADGRTLDSTNVLIAAIITAAIGTLQSTTGSLATSFLVGKLQPVV